MRYNLYSADEERVDLEKEVQYLNDYIDIQKMRLSGNVKIKFVVFGDVENSKIEPLLFIPFVENAFKHGISVQNPSEINIILNVQPKIITFSVANTVFPVAKSSGENGCIGLKNVQRRLNILYPDNHQITITNDGLLYRMVLKLGVGE